MHNFIKKHCKKPENIFLIICVLWGIFFTFINPVFQGFDEIEHFYKIYAFSDGTLNLLGCPKVNTEVLERHGLKKDGKFQILDGFAVFPPDYFNPYDDPTGRLSITENTYSIHWYSKSWMSKKAILRSKLLKPVHRILGMKLLKG